MRNRKNLSRAVFWMAAGGLAALPWIYPPAARVLNWPVQAVAVLTIGILVRIAIRDRRDRRLTARVPVGAHVVLAGRRFPVESLHLRQGGVEIQFVIYGPMPELSGDLTLFGEDGRGCWQSPDRHVPAISRGQAHCVTHVMRTHSVTPAR